MEDNTIPTWNQLISIINRHGFVETPTGNLIITMTASGEEYIDPDRLIGLTKKDIERKILIIKEKLLLELRDKLNTLLSENNKKFYDNI